MSARDELPAFVVEYAGVDVPFFRRKGTGYQYRCPGGCCRAWHSMATDRIISRTGAPVTITGTLACGCYCTWRVDITDGVARDV